MSPILNINFNYVKPVEIKSQEEFFAYMKQLKMKRERACDDEPTAEWPRWMVEDWVFRKCRALEAKWIRRRIQDQAERKRYVAGFEPTHEWPRPMIEEWVRERCDALEGTWMQQTEEAKRCHHITDNEPIEQWPREKIEEWISTSCQSLEATWALRRAEEQAKKQARFLSSEPNAGWSKRMVAKWVRDNCKLLEASWTGPAEEEFRHKEEFNGDEQDLENVHFTMENDFRKDCCDALVNIWDARKKLIEAEQAYKKLVSKM